MKYKALSVVIVLSLTGCFTHPNVDNVEAAQSQETLWIAPEKANCSDNPDGCFVVKRLPDGESEQWQSVPYNIIGFHYQPGTFYKIEISAVSETASGSKPIVLNDKIVLNHKLDQVLEKTTQYFLPATMLRAKRKWRLNTLASSPEIIIASLKKPPYLSLSKQGLAGFSGCNRIFGKQQWIFESADYQHSMIKFGPVAMTRMACIEPQANKVEHQMSLVLNQVNKFSVQWPFLNFYHDGKLLAQFVAPQPD